MLLMMFSNDTQKLAPYQAMDCDILLLQSGVYLLDKLPEGFRNVYVLEQHLKASGLAKPALANNSTSAIQLISETQWVELCATHQPLVSIQ